MKATEYGIAVQCEIHAPSENARHKAKTVEVQNESKAEKGAVGVNVKKFPSVYVKHIYDASLKIRQHYDSVLFCVNGWKIVDVEKWPEWKAELDNLIHIYNGAKIGLCEHIDSGAFAKALETQNGDLNKELKDLGKIPTREWIEKRFSIENFVDVDFKKLKGSLEKLEENIRKSLEKDTKETTKAIEAKAINEFLIAILTDVQGWLVDCVTRCNRKELKGTQFKTLVEKLNKLDDLKVWNVTKNAKVDAILDRMKNDFIGLSEHKLKESKEYRDEIVKKANAVMENLPTMFEENILSESMTKVDLVLELEAKQLAKKSSVMVTVAPIEPSNPSKVSMVQPTEQVETLETALTI